MSRRGARPPAGDRVYGALLHLYPRAFRARFGADMRETFARDRARAGAAGPRTRAAFWMRTLVEAFAGAFGARLSPSALASRPFGADRRSVMTSRFAVDCRDAWRALRATPLVTSVAVLSLALGIGANTALFSILNGLVLRPLPVRAPEELVALDHGSWTNPIWEQIRDERAAGAAGAFAWTDATFDLSREGRTDPVDGLYASGRIFEVLGLQPLRGRLFAAADDVRGGGPDGGVAVVSYRFWQQRLGGDERVAGRTLRLNHVPFTIIGVLPPSFAGLEIGRAADVIVPLGHEPLIRGAASALDNRQAWWLEIMFRLAPHQTIADATARLRGAAPHIRAATMPSGPGDEHYLDEPFDLVPAATGQSRLRGQFTQPLTILMVVVGAVLLIACANIANLLLARAAARRRDLSIRLALGASRGRIARQLACESLLLAAAGASLGLAVARVGSVLLVRQLDGPGRHVVLDTSIDLRVLAFTAGVGILTALLFGVAPALGATRVSPHDALKDQGRTMAGDRRAGLRHALVVLQVSLSLVLLIGAGLFIQTFTSLVKAPLGFDVEPLLTARLDTEQVRADAQARTVLFERLRAAAAETPGVAGAAISSIEPLSGAGWNTRLDLPDRDRGRPGIRSPWVNAVTPGWFAAYGMTLLAGRDFTPADRAGSPPVVIVNDAFAQRFLGGGNPVGRHFRGGLLGPGQQTDFEVVGLASNSVYRRVREGMPATLYLPFAQQANPWTDAALAVAVAPTASIADVEPRLAAALSAVDSRVAYSFMPFSDRVRSSVAQERLVALLSGFFGALALLLAGLGLYGVTTYAVSRRRTEIGVRMALGADAGGVVRLVLSRVGWLVGAGLVIGAATGLWVAKFLSTTLLYGLQPRDPATFAGAAVVLAAVGLAAGWLPARRAARIDPTQILREG